jgi:hypothetical protein
MENRHHAIGTLSSVSPSYIAFRCPEVGLAENVAGIAKTL